MWSGSTSWKSPVMSFEQKNLRHWTCVLDVRCVVPDWVLDRRGDWGETRLLLETVGRKLNRRLLVSWPRSVRGSQSRAHGPTRTQLTTRMIHPHDQNTNSWIHLLQNSQNPLHFYLTLETLKTYLKILYCLQKCTLLFLEILSWNRIWLYLPFSLSWVHSIESSKRSWSRRFCKTKIEIYLWWIHI